MGACAIKPIANLNLYPNDRLTMFLTENEEELTLRYSQMCDD